MEKEKYIIAIVGDSGSGKTLISLLMAEQLKWSLVVSYTTRPKRYDETDGKEHFFVGDEDVPPRKEMCAYTEFGGYKYWATWEQLIDDVVNVYVIDEKGLLELKRKKNLHIFAVYVKRNDKSRIDPARLKRDADRVRVQMEKYDYILHNNAPVCELKREIRKIEFIVKRLKFHNLTTKKQSVWK